MTDLSSPPPAEIIQPSDWPRLRIALPSSVTDDQLCLLTQAAVDAGALGGNLEGNEFLVYLPRGADPAPVADALAREADSIGWTNLQPAAEWIPDEPWATAWKDRFVTFPLGDSLLIRPDWEQGTPPPPQWSGRKTIWLRPGEGFGTGHHETTHLALALLERMIVPGDEVLDYGSGSGILAFAAAVLGARRVVAIEADPAALANARENLELNGLRGQVEFIAGTSPAAAPGRYSLIVCNMLPQETLPVLKGLAAALNGSKARLICTGFLADQKEEVESGMRDAGLRPSAGGSRGEWHGMTASPI